MIKKFLKTALATALFAVAGVQTAGAQDVAAITTSAGVNSMTPGYYYVVAGYNTDYALTVRGDGGVVLDQLGDKSNPKFIWYITAGTQDATEQDGTQTISDLNDGDGKTIKFYFGNPTWNYGLEGNLDKQRNVTIKENPAAYKWGTSNNQIQIQQPNGQKVSPHQDTNFITNNDYEVWGNYNNRPNSDYYQFVPVSNEQVTLLKTKSIGDFLYQAVTDLSVYDEKPAAFTISTNGRGYFAPKADGTGLDKNATTNLNFFIIKKEGTDNRYYLYNDGLGKFLTSTLAFSDKGDAFEISETATPDGDYKWTIKFDDANIINNTGSEYKISNYGTPDAGNRYKIINISDADLTGYTTATTAIATFKDVTYNAVYNGEVVKTQVVSHVVGDAVAIPTSFTSVPFCDFEADATEIGSETTEVNVTVTWQASAPYKLSTKANPRYYTWQSKDGQTIYASDENQTNDQGSGDATADTYTPTYGQTGKVVHIAEAYKTDDNYQWAFVGNPYQIEIINKAYPSKFLMFRNKISGNSSNAQLLLFDEGDYIFYWTVVDNSTGGTSYIGLNNGNNFWVRTDGGALNSVQCPGLRNGTQISNGANDAARFTVTEIIPAYTVTYQAVLDGDVVKTESASVKEGTAIALPESFNAAYADVALADGTPETVTEDVTVTINVTNFEPPFELGTYYNLAMRPTDVRYASTETNDAGNYLVQPNTTEYKRTLDAYQWKLTGNPYAIQVVAKDGSVVTLSDESNFATLEEDGTFTFTLVRVDDTTFRLQANGLTVTNGQIYLADYQNPGKLGRYTADDGTKIQVTGIPTAATEVALTVGEAGYATFASQWPLDFSAVTDVKAYRAVKNDDMIDFEQVTGTVPAEEGLLIKGTKGTGVSTAIPVATTTPDAIENVFVGTLVSKVLNTGDYVLYQTAFYVVGENSVTLPAGKAYIPASAAAGARIAKLDFDETTGISEMKTMEQNSIIYNLNGVRVAQPTKGLYIVNGKKMVVK